MKPHELFELIIILSCNEYGVSWQEAILYDGNEHRKLRTRRVISYLTATFIGADFAKDILNIHGETVNKHIHRCKKDGDGKALQGLIYIYLKTKDTFPLLDNSLTVKSYIAA